MLLFTSIFGPELLLLLYPELNVSIPEYGLGIGFVLISIYLNFMLPTSFDGRGF
jgi:hypothetical protein